MRVAEAQRSLPANSNLEQHEYRLDDGVHMENIHRALQEHSIPASRQHRLHIPRRDISIHALVGVHLTRGHQLRSARTRGAPQTPAETSHASQEPTPATHRTARSPPPLSASFVRRPPVDGLARSRLARRLAVQGHSAAG